MSIVVFGASGRAGGEVVTQALARGFDVRAASRHPALDASDRLRPIATDVIDIEQVAAALEGLGPEDGVISTLGAGTSRQATTLYSQGTANIARAMRDRGMSRVAVTSAAPVGDRSEQAWLDRTVIMPVLDRFFGASYRDMAVMETDLASSDLRWASLRPPRLIAKPSKNGYRASVDGPVPRARSLTYADLATALIDALDEPSWTRRVVSVAN